MRRTILLAAVPYAAAILIYRYLGEILPAAVLLTFLAACILYRRRSGERQAGLVSSRQAGSSARPVFQGQPASSGRPKSPNQATSSGQPLSLTDGRALLTLMISFGISWGHMLLIDAQGSELARHEGEQMRLEGVIRTCTFREESRASGQDPETSPARAQQARAEAGAQQATAEAEARSQQAGDQGQRQARMEVAAAEIGGAPPGTEKIFVTYRVGAEEDIEEILLPGQRIVFSGTVEVPQTKTNPNCFDYRLYLRTRGIRTCMRAEEIGASGVPAGPFAEGMRRLSRCKTAFLTRLADHTDGQTAGFLRAMMFGEKGGLDEELQEVFQKNGTAHVLAVSGLHIGIIYGMLLKLWDVLSAVLPKLFGVRRDWRFFLFIACFFSGYTALAAFSASVLRASGMVLLHAFAQMTGRRYDLCCAACAVGLAALAVNPWTLFGAGFQMSFLAILTLSMLTPYVEKLTGGVLAGSLCIQLGLAPYMLYQFNYFSPAALLINIPVIFLTGLLVPLGLASMFLPPAGLLADPVIGLLSDVMIRLNAACQIDGITSIRAASPHPVWILLYYSLLILAGSETGRLMILRKQQRQVLAAAAVLTVSSFALGLAADDGFRHMDLVFVDVGQGDCIHLRAGGKDFLIDGGGSMEFSVGEKTLMPYLLKNGVSRVDGAFVTHLHTDHYKGICELAKAGMVERLFLYDGNRVKEEQVCEETGLAPSQLTYLRQGHRVELSDDAALTVLWPRQNSLPEYRCMAADEEDENASSLIMRVEAGGVSLLATGDLGEEGEGALLQAYEEDARAAGAGTAFGAAAGSADNAPADSSGNGRAAGPANDGAEGHCQSTAGFTLQADILKVGHHGSKTSSSDGFLDAVRPAFAVIQVGENNMYGHPTPEVLERLAQRGIPVWRNDLQGAVGMRIRGGAVRSVKTMK